MTVWQVHTTLPSKEEAEALARGAVERRLAACAQVVGPIGSFYRWNGAVESAQEWLLLLKTTEERYPELELFLDDCHPYEEPEIVAVPVLRGAVGYLGWVAAETRG